MLITLAKELGKLPNKIHFEGHTDSKSYAENSNYTNWELSVHRANTARKILQQHGLRADQVTQVRGYAGQSLWGQGGPLDPANRKISLIAQYRIKEPDEKSDEHPAGEEKPGGEKNPAAEGKVKEKFGALNRPAGFANCASTFFPKVLHLLANTEAVG